MKSHLTHFVDSFHFTKQFFKTLLWDALSIGGVSLLFSVFFSYITAKGAELTGGQTSDQLQNMILNSPTNQVATFASELKTFIIIFIAGLLILLLVSSLFFVYTRKKIWGTLVEIKSVPFSRWFGLQVLVSVFAILYGLVVAIFRTGVTIVLNSAGQNAIAIITAIISVIFLLIFLFFSFAVGYGLQKKGKVFEGISLGLSELFGNMRLVCGVFLFGLVVLALITLFFYLGQSLTYVSSFTITVINITLFILYLSWLRWYFVKVIQK